MRRTILVLLLCAWQGLAHAAHTPARLLEGDHSIENLLSLPKSLKPGRYTVQCEALVLKNGRSGAFNCYTDDRSLRRLVYAVAYAGKIAWFAPATRDGVPTDIFMLVMVRIDITEQGPLVLVVPNNGADAARYGLLYTAPQRFNEFTWSSHFRPVARPVVVWQRLLIDERGTIVEHSLKNASDSPEWIVRSIDESVARMEFIPGFYEGKAVPMFYVEPAWSHCL